MSTQQYLASWRWHFFAGVIVVPFLLMLAITGLVMVYYTAVETPLGERITVNVSNQPPTSPMQQLAAAKAALPDAKVTQYIPARSPEGTAQFELIRAADTYVVDIDPYHNQVLRIVDKNRTPYAWAQRIHGTMLMGYAGDVMLEVIAGLAFLLIVTGAYMWLRQRKPAPASDSSKRSALRRWHLLIGLYSSAVLCFFLLSGFAWTNIWGNELVQVWGSFPAEKWGPVSLSTSNHSSMNHGAAKEVPWGLEQTPMPTSTGHAHHFDPGDGISVDLNSVDKMAQEIGFGPRYRINLPQDATGVYTISSTSMTGDIDVPGEERTVHVDQHSGEIVAEVGFDDYSVMAKSMAVGVAVHQASMGWWNVALNVLACAAVIFLCVSGTLMWWLRSPARARRWVPVPPRTAGLPLRSGLTVLLVVLGVSFPLLGATLVVGLLGYVLVGRYQQ